mgnify:CR=1 FL=1
MKKHSLFSIFFIFILFIGFAAVPSHAYAEDYGEEFPQENAWYQATPSVVWMDDPESTTTLEVHIVGRNDVARVWVTDLGSDEEEGRKELFDDGTHGDETAGDNVFTLSDVVCPPYHASVGYDDWWGMLRVQLKDGTMMVNNYGMIVGMVDDEYKDIFPVQEFGDGLWATPYAFFIEDTSYEIFADYPVSDIYCGQEHCSAAQKLYSVFPDVFDYVTLMPGMQVFRISGLAENVPYHICVSNNVENIGLAITDNTEKYGSDGRLKSFVYHSFGSNQIMDHEMGHLWSAYIGDSLGVTEGVHWNDMSDVQGQMGLYYFEDEAVGHFAYNGDETWNLIPNIDVEPYSPLELYVMGLIPSSEVPDIHILKNPDLTDTENITVDSYKTITMQQIVESEGGERVPSYEDSQKDFNMAFVVAQDMPYNDAAYAYFSLVSLECLSCGPPLNYSFLAPFYWATGGRATLNTYLGDYGVLQIEATAEPTAVPEATPAAEPEESQTVEPETEEVATLLPTQVITPEPETESEQQAQSLSTNSLLVISLVLAAGAFILAIFLIKTRKK